MPLHDLTAVDAGSFHAFHLEWSGEKQKVLNGGVLRDADILAERDRRAARLTPNPRQVRLWRTSP